MKILKRAKRRRIITLIWCIIIEIIIFASIFVVGTTEEPDLIHAFIILCYGMVPILSITIIILITCCTSLYTRSFNKYIEKMSEEQLEQFNREIESGYKLDQNIFTSDALVIPSGLFLEVVPLDKLVWLYLGEPYICGATVSQIYFVTDEKKRVRGYINRLTKISELNEFLRLIQNRRENVIIGFQPEYHKLYQSNFKEMVRRANQKSD